MRNNIFSVSKKQTFKWLTIFFLFANILVSYSQNGVSKENIQTQKSKSFEGVIQLHSQKEISDAVSKKTRIISKKRDTKTSKTAADTQPPTIICPSNQVLACGTTIPSYFDLLTVDDDISDDIHLTQSPGEGGFFYDGMTVVFTARDEAGNENTCSIVVTASTPDVTPPTFTCPTGLTFNCGDKMPNYALNPMMNLDDDCSIELSYIMTPGPGSDFYDGIPVQIEYFDKVGNRSVCNFTVTMATPDVTKPVITYCPGNQSVACGTALPDYRTLIEAVDNCLENMSVSQSPAPGSAVISGMSVTMTVKDAANNEAICSFLVNTSDTTKPTITCPGNQTLATGDVLPDYKSLVTAFDNCTANPTITQTPTVGSTFTHGMTVAMRATDALGNFDECSFIVNAIGGDLPPIMECPVNQELYANSTLPNYVHFLTAISDDVDNQWELIFTQTPAAGTVFTADTEVTVTVEDKSGNKTSCSFLVKLKTGGFDIDCKTTTINTDEINGINGFKIYGEKSALRAGFSTSPVGDVNGDGIVDFIIGAPGDEIPEGCYVVFGTDLGFPATINLADLNGLNGFKIIDDDLSPPRRTGFDVSSAGDINGDGIDDLMLSDPSKRLNASVYFSGRVYIIYGKKTGFSSVFLLSNLNGTNGFSILGQTIDEGFGRGIANIGDFNNDSHNDIAIVSANKGSGNVKKCYILFGKSTNFLAVVNVESLDSSNSFIIEGDVGVNVAGVGDINGDGISDVAISGEDKFRYVIYGSASLPAKITTNTLNGSNGFKIENSVSPLVTSYYFEIRSAGDMNGDSYHDIGINNYVLFGKSTFSAVVDLKDLDGTNGFKMNGSEYDFLHTFSSFGDFNQDGFDDYLLPYQNTSVYLIYGKANWDPLLDIFSLNSSQGLKISTRYTPKYSLSFVGDVNGDTVDDIIIGSTKTAYTSDANEDPGMSYVIFGKKTIDAEKPVITNCPDSQFLAINDPIPDYTSVITVTDNCDDSPIIVQSPVAGAIFDGVTQDIILTVTDASGNESICSFTISVLGGDLPPIIECPSGMELYANSTLPNYVSLLPIVTDDKTDDLDLVFTQTPPQGTLFTADTNVTITVKDASGNTKSCSFLVKLRTATADIDCKTKTLEVSNLNGTNGFSIYGEKLAREMGYSVDYAGDVNGDGIADVIIGAPGGFSHSYGHNRIKKIIEGRAYVVFGKSSGFSPNIDLGLLDGSNGFAIVNDNAYTGFWPITGYVVGSAGDINGDGIDDFMISDPSRNSSNGYIYFVFGKSTGFPAEFNLSTLNGNNGFTLIGKNDNERIGISMSSVGDINGDGFMDIATVTSESVINGKCYVLYGKNGGFPAEIRTDELDGTNGFTIAGDAIIGKIGESVIGLGDVNGDGISDMGIGTYGDFDQHRKYVIFGSSNFPMNLNVSELNGSNGFVVEHTTAPLISSSGISKAGDINGDGINDIAVTSQYILFGKTTFPALMDLKNLNGTNGFKISNPDTVGGLGRGFGYAGDFNADGIDDYFYQTNNKTQVVFGKKDWAVTPGIYVETFSIISDLYQATATTITYTANYAGDINNDGISDLIIGNRYSSYLENLKVNTNYGMSYVVFGKKPADSEKPAISNCPANQVLAMNDLVPDYTKVITVTDNCDTNPIVSQSPVAGSIFDGISQEVILTATDANGNSETCKFNIGTTADIVAPIVTCLIDQQLNCETTTIPDYTALVTVTDDVDSSPTLTQSPAVGSPFVDGMTIIITAKDASNNESTCNFIVSASADLTPPTFTCIGNQTLSCGDVLPDYTALITATDNCSASVVITQNPFEGTVFTDGMTVEIMVGDASGNTDSCSFIVNASADTTPPVFTSCLPNQSLAFNAILPDYTSNVTVFDTCDTDVSVTQNPLAGSVATNGMVVVLTATDASSNTETCSFTIVVGDAPIIDTEKPVLSCLQNQLVACGTKTILDYRSRITATDNVDNNPTITQNPAAGSVYVEGMTVTLTATDASGNNANCSFMVNSNTVLIDAGNDTEINEGEIAYLKAIASTTGSFSWSPTLGVGNSHSASFSANPTETTTYTVIFTSTAGCVVEDSVTITVIPKKEDETKYGLSPNNDGINDFWKIDGIEDYPKNKVSIYNRWGDLVFQIDGYNNSTNVFSGIANRLRNMGADVLPEGTYFFDIDVSEPNHFNKTKGYLVLKH